MSQSMLERADNFLQTVTSQPLADTLSQQGMLEDLNWISLTALILSILALLIALMKGGGHSKPKVKTRTTLKRAQRDEPAKVTVEVTNLDAEPLVLATAWSRFSDGTERGERLEKNGVRLATGQSFTEAYEDYMVMTKDSAHLTEVWYEDALGRRYPVKNAERLFRLLIR